MKIFDFIQKFPARRLAATIYGIFGNDDEVSDYALFIILRRYADAQIEVIENTSEGSFLAEVTKPSMSRLPVLVFKGFNLWNSVLVERMLKRKDIPKIIILLGATPVESIVMTLIKRVGWYVEARKPSASAVQGYLKHIGFNKKESADIAFSVNGDMSLLRKSLFRISMLKAVLNTTRTEIIKLSLIGNHPDMYRLIDAIFFQDYEMAWRIRKLAERSIFSMLFRSAGLYLALRQADYELRINREARLDITAVARSFGVKPGQVRAVREKSLYLDNGHLRAIIILASSYNAKVAGDYADFGTMFELFLGQLIWRSS